ncbi:MAG TPA: 50S ribosomal protein L18 [Candidatus Bathyarchaeota archaeon]|nr:50S ribosomal protein L18 [Candidatus Bathyarchaeota archaeon]
MATGPRYRVPFRRRKEGKTNYRSRRALVLSRVPRLVVRLTLKHAIVQVIEAETVGDRVIVSANSRELAKTYGWLGNCGNIPSAYLTGLLCGFKAMDNGVERAFLDVGLHIPSKGTRLFAALKGVVDAGVEVPHSEDIISDEDRISGKHIADYAANLASEPDVYKQRFSAYLSKGSRPEEIPERFSVVKDKIKSSFERKVKTRKEET